MELIKWGVQHSAHCERGQWDSGEKRADGSIRNKVNEEVRCTVVLISF